MADPEPFARLLVEFGQELRRAGMSVGTGDVLTYCAAVAELDPTDLLDLYWGGRASLVSRREDLAVYDRVFRRFFLDASDTLPEPLQLRMPSAAQEFAVLTVPATEPGQDGHDEQEARLGLVASAAAGLKNKSFSTCTPDELAALRRIMSRLKLTPPRRRTRRTVSAPAGRRPDPRRTVRETMRMHGEPAELFWRSRRPRARRLVLILDVSGSMADYSRNLLQFAYSARRVSTQAEVFCFGTRLTRITRELERRRVDDALDLAAKAVVDWEGGTRIGASLDTFVRVWGRRGLCRGAIVVVCSDGLDRGDPAVLAASMERLSRLSHRIVWLNPHRGESAEFTPTTLGMMAAAPYVDVVLSGHDLRSLEHFAEILPELG